VVCAIVDLRRVESTGELLERITAHLRQAERDLAQLTGREGRLVTDDDSPRPDRSSGIDTSVPHAARVWNYWLGGKDNYAVDRKIADEILAVFPAQAQIARQSRAFLTRAVSYLAAEAGIRQFLDIGTGLPTASNTHEVAQRQAAESRIVYVDNDPLVLAHARSLLRSTPEGACAYIDADLHDPDRIITEAARTLDLAKPIAVMLLGILGYVPDQDRPGSIVARLVSRLSPGSYVVINDGTNVVRDQTENESAEDSPRARVVALYAETGAVPYHLRTPEQIEGFFAGLELIDPGVVSASRWRPEASPFGPPAMVDSFCGVGRKP
jgi:O-methyltransferase involved in polyketide biosynthesis